jgi:hypothetical protein
MKVRELVLYIYVIKKNVYYFVPGPRQTGIIRKNPTVIIVCGSIKNDILPR